MTPTIAIVGGALRGTSVLERIGEVAGRRIVHVIVVDPHPPAAGAVWRTDQSPLLLMNTPASASTLWPDTSDRAVSFWEWVQAVSRYLGSEEQADSDIEIDPLTLAAVSQVGELRAAVHTATPESFLPRALHGHYLTWAYRRIVDCLPVNVTHEWLAGEVTDIRSEGGLFHLRCSGSGADPTVQSVVLATGWRDDRKTAYPVSAVHPKARRIDAGSPIRQELDAIAPGEHVLTVGMGLSFFDAVTLLTAGRGGTFDEHPDGALTYRRSGAEPVIIATSRRGFPFRSRLRGAVTHSTAHATLKAVAAQLGSESIDFQRQLLPAILHDASAAYYEDLSRRHPETVRVSGADFADVFARCAPGSTALEEYLEDAVTDPVHQFNPSSLLDRPAKGWASPAAFRTDVLRALRRDIEDAARESPLRAATRSFCEARRVLVPIIRYGALRSAQVREDYQRYADRVSFLSNGPPPRRLRELVALLEAGVVDTLGPWGVHRIDPDTGKLSARSALVADSGREIGFLLDARVPKPSVLSDDPLLAALRSRGMIRPWRPDIEVVSDAVDTERDTGEVIDSDGAVVPGMVVSGLLAWDFRLHSLMAPTPGNDALFFIETASIASYLIQFLYPTGPEHRSAHMYHRENRDQDMPQDQSGRTVVNIDQLVEVDEAARRRGEGAVFIDVRRRDKGGPVPPVPGAVIVDKQQAAKLLDPSSPNLLSELAGGLDADIVVFCNSEFGSDPVVGQLNDFGYRSVSHLNGGYRAWESAAEQ